MSIQCPQPETLRSYISGKSMGLETEEFESHLASCMQCQADLEILSEESDSLTRLVAETSKIRMMAGNVAETSRSSVSENVPFAQRESSSNENSGLVSHNSMIRDYRILECIGQGGMGSV